METHGIQLYTRKRLYGFYLATIEASSYEEAEAYGWRKALELYSRDDIIRVEVFRK